MLETGKTETGAKSRGSKRKEDKTVEKKIEEEKLQQLLLEKIEKQLKQPNERVILLSRVKGKVEVKKKVAFVTIN